MQQQDEQPDSRLLSLLDAFGVFEPPARSLSINVVPRLGTRSAWSSKATDIARRCGMSTVERIERGISFQMELAKTDELASERKHQIVALLHDRMTETTLEIPEQLGTTFR